MMRSDLLSPLGGEGLGVRGRASDPMRLEVKPCPLTPTLSPEGRGRRKISRRLAVLVPSSLAWLYRGIPRAFDQGRLCVPPGWPPSSCPGTPCADPHSVRRREAHRHPEVRRQPEVHPYPED